MSEIKIILIGGGGHCHSCIDVIERTKAFTIAGILEKEADQIPGNVMGYPVIGFDRDLERLRKNHAHALVTLGQIGTASIRSKIFNRLKALDYTIPTVVSPLAYVSRHALIGEGTIVMHHALVNAGTRVGKNCILNTKCLIEHDVTIGNHTHISTGTVLNGGVHVGDSCFVGSSAVVVQGVDIPDTFFIKAGRRYPSEEDGNPAKE